MRIVSDIFVILEWNDSVCMAPTPDSRWNINRSLSITETLLNQQDRRAPLTADLDNVPSTQFMLVLTNHLYSLKTTDKQYKIKNMIIMLCYQSACREPSKQPWQQSANKSNNGVIEEVLDYFSYFDYL